MTPGNGCALWQPDRLWSLLDIMRELKMTVLMNLFRAIEDQDVRFMMVDVQNSSAIEFGQVPSAKLDGEDLAELAKRIERMAAFADQLGLSTARALLEARKTDLPKTGGEWRMLIEAIHAEMRGKLVLYVPPERARFYRLKMSDAAVDAFPNACVEVQNAGKALAAGMFTSSVFHAMRAAEIGVRALSADMGVTFNVPADQVEWRKHQNQIAGKITAIENSGKSVQRDKDLEFYAQNAAQLQYFNDGWRIRAAHARATYDEGQAISVLNHTIALIEGLAPRVKEPGV